jgi:hypothetical protein
MRAAPGASREGERFDRGARAGAATPAARRTILLLACAPIASIVLLAARLLAASDLDRVAQLPDDSFYYLTLARNFVETRLWSFDHGITTTSGFHTLYAYLLALLAAPGPGDRTFLDLASLLTSAVSVAILIVALRAFLRGGDYAMALALAVVAGSAEVGLTATIIMEWPFAVLFSALFWTELARTDGRLAGIRPRASLWALLLVLSRSDMIVGVGAIAALELVAQLRERRLRPATGLVPASALLGWALVALQSRAITGHWIQDSAAAKLLWAREFGPSVGPILTFVAQIFSPVGGAFAVVLRPRAGAPALAPPRTGLTIAALAVIAAYLCLYTFNGAMDIWYSAPFLAPLVITIAWGISFANRVFSVRTLAAAAAVYLALHAASLHALRDFREPQRALYALAHAARPSAAEARIGSLNAGLVGYYEGGRVVNLDGLMNSDIGPYRARGALACYLVDRRIRYLHELDLAKQTDVSWRRYGDPDRLIAGALREIDSRVGPRGSRAVAYEVDLDALARAPVCLALREEWGAGAGSPSASRRTIPAAEGAARQARRGDDGAGTGEGAARVSSGR